MWLYRPGRINKQLFFFSSRRRHTRFKCDWSSDVCSSDLRFVPGLVRSGMRELIRAGDVAAGVDVGIEGPEEFVGFDGARPGQADAQFLQTVARGIGNAPERAQQLVERN